MNTTLLEDVRVWTEKTLGQQQQISATIAIPYAIEQVWQVLTDYEQMPTFIPNLLATRRLFHPTAGIRLEQVGYCQVLKIRFSARAVLDVVEQFPDQITFQMIEGDFQEFAGHCRLEPISDIDGKRTILHYSVQLVPKLNLPISLLKRQLYRDLPVNLLAIRQRLDTLQALHDSSNSECEFHPSKNSVSQRNYL